MRGITIPVALTLVACAHVERIDAPSLYETLDSERDNTLIVDVRTRGEFTGRKGHIPGAVNLPYPGVLGRTDEIAPSPGQTVVLVCHTGTRSRLALRKLGRALDVPVIDLQGGMTDWWRHGLPTEQEQAP